MPWNYHPDQAISGDYNDKVDKYNKGEWKVTPPPVCTGQWNTHAWIMYIDEQDGWIDTD